MKDETKTLQIVYNGENVVLNEEEAITLAQKGMNYDRLYEKFRETSEALKEAENYKNKIEGLAKEAGTTPANIMGLLDENIKEMQVSNYAENEKIPPEYAEKLMGLTREIEVLRKEKEELLPLKKRQEDIKQFEKEYPGLDVNGLDKDVLKLWETTDKPLTDIYNSVMLKKLLNKKEADNANEQNRRASSGSVKDSSAGERTFTEDDIRKMSDEEIKNNFKTLLKQLSKKEMNN